MDTEDKGTRMYRVEKFEPTHCPFCSRKFSQENIDWAIYFGQVIDGHKIPDPDWPRIMCRGCDKLVKIQRIQDYQVKSRATAERLIAEEGFCNLQVVRAWGNMAQDHVTDHANNSQLKVINCEPETKLVLLFVYGTLKKGGKAHCLIEAEGGRFLREAKTGPQYKLHGSSLPRNDWFPLMAEMPKERNGVIGELYEIPTEAFTELDHYEAVDHGLFRRVEIEMDDGNKAWSYVYNQSLLGCTPIMGGFWNGTKEENT